MVNAPENRALLTGVIAARNPHPKLDGFDLLEVAVQSADDVPDMRNLLAPTVGTTINVAVVRGLLGDAKAGDTLRCVARRTPDGAIADREPAPGAFAVTPGKRPRARRTPPRTG